MNKTPIGQECAKQIAAVNDQLCFAALVQHELAATIRHHATSSPQRNTVEIFPSNPHAPRIFRLAKDLPQFAVNSTETATRMAVVYGYEHLFAYFEDVQAFRAKAQPSPEDQIKADAIEDQLRQRLGRWLPDVSDIGYFRTIGYLRHLRNSFAHAHSTASKKLSHYASTNAHALNKFWNNSITDLGGMNFRTIPQQTLSYQDAFALINLLRICLREVDRMFASTLDPNVLLKIALAEAWTRHPHIRANPTRLVAKASGLIRSGYGARPASSILVNAASKFVAEATTG